MTMIHKGEFSLHIQYKFLISFMGITRSEARGLREMAHSSFMELVRLMYRSFLNCIEGLQTQAAIILDVLEAIRYASSLPGHPVKADHALASRQPGTPINTNGVREALADILSSAGELANVRASKVLNMRSEQHTALELPNFYMLFNISWDFVVKSEVMCKRMIVALRGVLVSQVCGFLAFTLNLRIERNLAGQVLPTSISSVPTITVCEAGRRRAVESCGSPASSSTHDQPSRGWLHS